MKMNLKTSAALVLAALLSAAPALAATNDSAVVTSGTRTDALAVSALVPMIGRWTSADLGHLDRASTVKVFDTRTLYQAADLKKIASAETNMQMQLGKVHDAIRGDAALAAWFKAHDLDINRVVAVADPNGSPEIFLY